MSQGFPPSLLSHEQTVQHLKAFVQATHYHKTRSRQQAPQYEAPDATAPYDYTGGPTFIDTQLELPAPSDTYEYHAQRAPNLRYSRRTGLDRLHPSVMSIPQPRNQQDSSKLSRPFSRAPGAASPLTTLRKKLSFGNLRRALRPKEQVEPPIPVRQGALSDPTAAPSTSYTGLKQGFAHAGPRSADLRSVLQPGPLPLFPVHAPEDPIHTYLGPPTFGSQSTASSMPRPADYGRGDALATQPANALQAEVSRTVQALTSRSVSPLSTRSETAEPPNPTWVSEESTLNTQR